MWATTWTVSRRRPGTGRRPTDDVGALAVEPLRLRRARRDARQHAELRPVVEQRDARAARDVRGLSRAHAVHREQLAVRLHAEGARLGTAAHLRARRGGLLRRPAVRRAGAAGLHGALRAHAPVLLPAGQDFFARASSSCWPASTTTCSRGAAPASIRTASRSSGSRARSITATRRSAGRLSIPLCCVTRRHRRRRRPPGRSATARCPTCRAGVKLSLDRWRGIGAQGFGQPDILPLRSACRASGAGSRSPSSCPCPASRKSRSAAASPRTRSSRSSRARSPIDRENALSLNAEVTIGTGLARPVHGPDRRRAVPDAAQPGRPDAGADLPAEHRQRHRDVRRRRQPEDDQLARASSSASSTTCPSPTGASGCRATTRSSSRPTSSA